MKFSKLHDEIVKKFPEYENKDYRPYGRNRIVIFLDSYKSVVVHFGENGLMQRRLIPTWLALKEIP